MKEIKQIFDLKERYRKHLFQYKHFGVSNDAEIELLTKQELKVLSVLNIVSDLELCRFFKTDILQLENIINYPQYDKYFISKKRGGKREILAPSSKLKKIQKMLNSNLQQYYSLVKPNFVHGFTINDGSHKFCNIKANASVHTGKKYLLSIDLKDFFPSIKASRVKELFVGDFFRYSESVATALSLLCTYQGKLPIGAPTSPVLSNFICYDLDIELAKFCAENSMNFSRYADDLSFSSNTKFNEKIISQIVKLIEKNNFQVNKNKLYLRNSGQKQTVTGLIVNQRVNVDRKLLKRIRAMLFDVKSNGAVLAAQNHFSLNTTPDHSTVTRFIHKLEGYVNFVGQVRGKNDFIYLRMKEEFDLVFDANVS